MTGRHTGVPGRRRRPAPTPDPITGEPRPPKAHRGECFGQWVTIPTDLEKCIVPQHYGPALEAYEEPKRNKMQGVGCLFGLGVLAFAIPFRGFDWISMWFPWVFILGLTFLQYRKVLGDRVLAGSRWVQQRDKWVSTYELTKIRSTTNGLNRASKIEDANGNKLTLVLRDAQENPLLWDLVYNGIVHSVASGNCDISKAARRILKV